ncbi:MAG: hypothetical protein HYX33_00180 [Actinobacteria bacterium]|nr:hypothetical protein [Actinomycetota bacterium]
MSGWLGQVTGHLPDWWDAGSGEGGGLAMNDGVAVLVGVLRSCCTHLGERGTPMATLTAEELLAALRPFAEIVGEHLAGLDDDARESFRRGARGVQGQTSQRRRVEAAIRASMPKFSPQGLDEYLEAQEQRRSEQAFKLIASIEKTLKTHVIETLRAEFDAEEKPDAWWYEGVKTPIRKVARERQEDAGGDREVEDCLDLIHFRSIAADNWAMFKETLAYGSQGKDTGTKWIIAVNDVRKVVMHPSSDVEVSATTLDQLREYERWLKEQCGETPTDGQ